MVLGLLILLLILLILVAMVYQLQDNVGYTNAVLAIDQGEQDTELAFVCNSFTTNSVDSDCSIYSSPLPAQDNGTLKTQLVL